MPPHLARRRLRPNGRRRHLQRALRSLSSRKQPLLGRRRRSRHLHGVSRSTQTSLSRCRLLRRKLPRVPRIKHRREKIRKSSRRRLPCRRKKLCHLPHAQSRAAHFAFRIHRSLDPHRASKFRLSRITTCATTSISAAIFSATWRAPPRPPLFVQSFKHQPLPTKLFLSPKFLLPLPA